MPTIDNSTIYVYGTHINNTGASLCASIANTAQQIGGWNTAQKETNSQSRDTESNPKGPWRTCLLHAIISHFICKVDTIIIYRVDFISHLVKRDDSEEDF